MKIYELQLGKLYEVEKDIFLSQEPFWIKRNSIFFLVAVKECVVSGMYTFTILLETKMIEFSIHKTTYGAYIKKI